MFCIYIGLAEFFTPLLTIKILTLCFTIFRTLVELYQLYSKKVIGYFLEWINWFEFAQNIAILVFLFSVDDKTCYCSAKWEWEVGIVSLALTWFVLIIWLQTMPWIGIYVTIMLNIIVSFLKVAVFGLLLVVSFGLTFYTLFYQPPPRELEDMVSVCMRN